MEKQQYYITTAIAYTSGKPHIGNVYEIILADSIARYKRLDGYDVFFQTGTDEHGQKIEDKASEMGITPQEYVDDVANVVKQMFDLANTSYDKFVRTTDNAHKETVQKIFKRLYEQGDIYKGEYEGWYCKSCESFFTEAQLLDRKCPDCKGDVYIAKEETYFFRMSKYQERLMKHIEEHPEFIQPESRKNEMINNFLKPGLQDLAVSRTSFKWGIPVDFDDKHVIYVWVDALSNYITGLGYDVDGNHEELYKKYWPADLHLIGKDILRFHTIYWPIILMALDVPLPKQIFGHPWILVGEGKMSKSKGNVIYLDELVNYFGVDAVRYYVLHEMPFAQDGVITWDLMIERINSDLANVLGNLVNRTISMANKYFNGVVESPKVMETIDDELIQLATQTPEKVKKHMDTLHVSDAITDIFVLLRRSNKYIDETCPWVLAKEEETQKRLQTVLYNLLESIRISAILLEPFIPDTSKKILNQIQTKQTAFDTITAFGNLEVGIKVVEKPEILFSRIDEKEFAKQYEADHKVEVKVKKEEITFDDFMKTELKVGLVEKCEKHPKADKLLISQINIGDEVRQVVSGIADATTPEEMVGKKVIVVTNLKPAKIRGVESQGMILVGEDDKSLEVVNVTNLEPGSIVR